MTDHHCIRCIIHGRVQGVWFRGSTQGQALQLGLRGHAYNLPDGTVEVIACGPAGGIDALREWLRQGPPMARVDRVVCASMDNDSGLHRDGFDIR